MNTYHKVATFHSAAAAQAAIQCHYGAVLPAFDAAEIFRDQHGDCVLRTWNGTTRRHYRVEFLRHGRWAFFGGILLINSAALDSAALDAEVS